MCLYFTPSRCNYVKCEQTAKLGAKWEPESGTVVWQTTKYRQYTLHSTPFTAWHQPNSWRVLRLIAPFSNAGCITASNSHGDQVEGRCAPRQWRNRGGGHGHAPERQVVHGSKQICRECDLRSGPDHTASTRLGVTGYALGHAGGRAGGAHAGRTQIAEAQDIHLER